MASVDDENGCVVNQSLSFQLAIDAAVYPVAADPSDPVHMAAVLVITSMSTPPLVLEFFSAQHYDVVITNGDGVAVYHWSHGRVFPQIARSCPSKV